MKIKIVIADDHPIFRRGLREVIEADERVEVSAEAANGSQAVKLIKDLQPDIAVIDIDMPEKNGFQVIRDLKDSHTKFVFLTMYKEENMFSEAMDNGISGYVLKESATEDMNECIMTVYNGEYYISPQISGYLVKRLNKKSGLENEVKGMQTLTATETKILRLIAQMKTTREISDQLFISYRTVEKHRTNISNKLGLKGSHSLLKFAIENKSRI